MANEDLEKLAKEFSEDLTKKLRNGTISLDEMPSRVADFLAHLIEDNSQKV